MIAAALTGGCYNKTWESTVVQPKLVLGGNATQRTSYPLIIKMSDMDLPKFCRYIELSPGRRIAVSCEDMDLLNTAYFVIVSKDRLRFHVTLHHKWETMSDPVRWRVWIEDDTGRRSYARIEGRTLRPITQMWGTEDRSPEVNARPPLYSITVWRGDGAYVFYRRDLFRRDMSRLALVLQRPGYTYRYVWSFVESEGQEPPKATENVLQPAPATVTENSHRLR
jgi:hypothetical protein